MPDTEAADRGQPDRLEPLALYVIEPSTAVTESVMRTLQVMPGLLLGGLLPFVFSGFTMLAVGRAAGAVIEEVTEPVDAAPADLHRHP